MPSGQVVLLVGAGHAHVEVLRAFAMQPMPGVAIVLATPARFTPYSGMLPGLVAGLYGFDEAHVDASGLAAAAGARFVEQAVVDLDLAARQARCADGRTIGYDLLSLDVGITPAIADVPGAADHAIPVKPIDGFARRFADLLGRVRAGDVRRIALVGAGAGGVELALAVERRVRREAAVAGRDPATIAMTIVTSGIRILADLPIGFSRRLERHLAKRGIDVLCGAPVTAVAAGHLLRDGHPCLPVDAVLWATGAAAPGWLQGTGLPLDPSGFIAVTAELEACGHPGVFAVGDVARFGTRGLPKAGVYAVRQGPVLAGNIRRCLRGEPLVRYRPQRDALVLMFTGDRHAVGTRSGIVVEGDWVWRVKDWLDRRWVARYRRV